MCSFVKSSMIITTMKAREIICTLIHVIMLLGVLATDIVGSFGKIT